MYPLLRESTFGTLWNIPPPQKKIVEESAVSGREMEYLPRKIPPSDGQCFDLINNPEKYTFWESGFTVFRQKKKTEIIINPRFV